MQGVCTYARMHVCTMKRITISLPDELALAAAREARRSRISVSALAREALDRHLCLTGESGPMPFANLGRSGSHQVARGTTEIMAKEWRRASS
jgi:hypothetical protein